jgi:hypothetical protein
MEIARAPERNVLINHRHARSIEIKIVGVTAFTLDLRLFGPRSHGLAELVRSSRHVESMVDEGFPADIFARSPGDNHQRN